jgi:tetrahydromethanopterin S-methyltransferase subunit B
MADPYADTKQQMQLTAIIEQLEQLNKTMDAMAKSIDSYVTMIGRQPVKTNLAEARGNDPFGWMAT